MDIGLYTQESAKRHPDLDKLNHLVPKAARVEDQRLHYGTELVEVSSGGFLLQVAPGQFVRVERRVTHGFNHNKLKIHFCPKIGLNFGKLPRRQIRTENVRKARGKANRLIDVVCGECGQSLKKSTLAQKPY